jgi:hypothetical protein
VVQRQPWPPASCGPHRRPRLVATFAIRFPPRKFMIAAAGLTTSQVLRNIKTACIQMRLRPDRPNRRQPCHPRLPADPCRAWLTTMRRTPRARAYLLGMSGICESGVVPGGHWNHWNWGNGQPIPSATWLSLMV